MEHKSQLREEAYIELETFRKDFEERWGVRLIAFPYHIDLGYQKISILELREIVNRYLPGAYTIEMKTRKHHVVAPRYIFYHIARRMGYTPTYIAENSYDDCHHSSVLAGITAIDTSIETGESEVLLLYGMVMQDVTKRLEDGGVVFNYNQGRSDT